MSIFAFTQRSKLYILYISRTSRTCKYCTLKIYRSAPCYTSSLAVQFTLLTIHNQQHLRIFSDAAYKCSSELHNISTFGLFPFKTMLFYDRFLSLIGPFLFLFWPGKFLFWSGNFLIHSDYVYNTYWAANYLYEHKIWENNI